LAVCIAFDCTSYSYYSTTTSRYIFFFFFFFSSRRRHTRSTRDWSSDVCSSDLAAQHHSDVDQQRPSHAHHNQRRYRVGQRPARRERHVPAPIHDGGELSLSLHEPYIPLPRLRGHHRRHPVISASGRSSAPRRRRARVRISVRFFVSALILTATACGSSSTPTSYGGGGGGGGGGCTSMCNRITIASFNF